MPIPNNSWLHQKEELQRAARKIDKSVILLPKDHWIFHLVWWTAAVFTLSAFAWGIHRKTFFERFATTIGPLQGYPKSWTYHQVLRVIIHESRHTRQCRWFGLMIHPWLGLPLYFVLYSLLLFPVGLAYFRVWFEVDADKAKWKVLIAEHGWGPVQVTADAKRRAAMVSSGLYFWPLPKSWVLKMHLNGADAALESALEEAA